MRTIDKNLADWYRKATPKHRKHGRAWYQDAHRFARGLSRITWFETGRIHTEQQDFRPNLKRVK